MPEDDPAEIVTPEALERISQGNLPVSRFEPDRIAIYTFQARVAKQWNIGNVFLAGDAAHQAPPLRWQGLAPECATSPIWRGRSIWSRRGSLARFARHRRE